MQSLHIFLLLFLCRFIVSGELDENLAARNTRRGKKLKNTKRRISISKYIVVMASIQERQRRRNWATIRFHFVRIYNNKILHSNCENARTICVRTFFRGIFNFQMATLASIVYSQFIAFGFAHTRPHNILQMWKFSSHFSRHSADLRQRHNNFSHRVQNLSSFKRFVFRMPLAAMQTHYVFSRASRATFNQTSFIFIYGFSFGVCLCLCSAALELQW